jgi:hypothetical protein
MIPLRLLPPVIDQESKEGEQAKRNGTLQEARHACHSTIGCLAVRRRRSAHVDRLLRPPLPSLALALNNAGKTDDKLFSSIRCESIGPDSQAVRASVTFP